MQVYVGRVNRAGGDGIGLARQVRWLFRSQGAVRRGPALVVASISTVSEVSAVAGADYLLVPPPLLQVLRDEPSSALLPMQKDNGIASLEGASEEDALLHSGFLLGPAEFETVVPELARQLLAVGLQNYQKQDKELKSILERASEYL